MTAEERWRDLLIAPRASLPVHLLRGGLYLASQVYGLGVFLHRTAYSTSLLRALRLPIPVIGVGNLTVGGVGKTPTVVWLAQYLQQQGWRPAIVSRGVGGAASAAGVLVADRERVLADAAQCGDEPRMLAQELPGVPVLAGRRRAPLALRALHEQQADTLVLDDALQHWKIHRRFNLLVLDATDPFGNRRLLPAGPLREPLTAIRRCHAAILTRADQVADADLDALRRELRGYRPELPIAHAAAEATRLRDLATGEERPLTSLRGTPVAALTSIARPHRFLETLRQIGVEPVAHVAYPNHHQYASADVRAVVEQARSRGARVIVTTDKDAAKLAPNWTTNNQQPVPCLALHLRWRWLHGLTDLQAALDSSLERIDS